MITAAEALQRLKEGNRRFVERVRSREPLLGASTRLELTQVQEPVAIILGCSDARVPAEIVFDQGLGDLFVIRIAGNIVSPSQLGSVEFAASQPPMSVPARARARRLPGSAPRPWRVEPPPQRVTLAAQQITRAGPP